MEVAVQRLLIEEVDHMIARAQQRAEQIRIDALRGDGRGQMQLALKNVQRSLERLRTYRQALVRERVPGSALAP